jgi:pimeloyl-ACP methyl ester carboxylesterase
MVADINGASLHYETFGEGEPLLWLHGFFGAGADWKYIFFYLRSRRAHSSCSAIVIPSNRSSAQEQQAVCRDGLDQGGIILL